MTILCDLEVQATGSFLDRQYPLLFVFLSLVYYRWRFCVSYLVAFDMDDGKRGFRSVLLGDLDGASRAKLAGQGRPKSGDRRRGVSSFGVVGTIIRFLPLFCYLLFV